MGASDILKHNDIDVDSARSDRNNRVNPPEFSPGQDTSFKDDIFSSDFTEPTSGTSFDGLGGSAGQFNGLGGLGGLGMGLGGGLGMGLGGQPQEPQKTDEDKFFEFAGKAAKGVWGFSKDFVSSFSKVSVKFWTKWGSRTTVCGLISTILGFILIIFRLGIGSDLMIGGLLASATGVITLMFNIEKAKDCTSIYKEDNQPMNLGSQLDFQGGFDSSFDISGDDDDDDFDTDPYSDDMDEDIDFGSDNGFDESLFDSITSKPEAGMGIEDALSTFQVIDKSMYTRQYLYETFIKVLPSIYPDFARVKIIDESSDTFIAWEQYLRDAAEITGVKEENLPDLHKLEENLFTIKVVCNRPTGFKPEAVAQEISNIYAYSSGEYDPTVYAKSDVVGKSCIITVFTGASALISLKDMYKTCEDFMLDSKNYMPVVLGIDQTGKAIKFDFKKLESIIITGMPRSGKSWFVQNILTQMCALTSPKQLNIYICDPKEGISDFKAFALPHVKKFVSGDDNIVNTLRSVVKEEAPRRKKIIGDAGFVNIWDYKERNPDVQIPIIYVLIDEVVTLASRMDKETNSEFRMLLRELISQLPAVGIRAFLIPHVLNNDIIEKKTSDLVPCKISVCGDADHIEKATGSKPKDFPYKLINKGDMAVRMPLISPSTLYVHGPALTESNTLNNDLFDYLRRTWSMLEPDEVDNSVAKAMEIKKQNDALLKTLDDTEELDLF